MRERYFITLQTWHCVITILEGDPKLIQLICYLETLSLGGFMTEKAPQVPEDLQDNSPLIDSNVTSTFDLVKTLLIVFSMSFLFRFRGKSLLTIFGRSLMILSSLWFDNLITRSTLFSAEKTVKRKGCIFSLISFQLKLFCSITFSIQFSTEQYGKSRGQKPRSQWGKSIIFVYFSL